MSNPINTCPSCGKKTITFKDEKHWVCSSCSFDLYFNVACSASVILYDGNSVLCIKRGRDPGKGLFSLPGGFIDAGETAEDACIRECIEETGIKPGVLEYIGSFPNTYTYKQITYNTCDFFYCVPFPVKEIKSLKPDDVQEIADFEIITLHSESDIEAVPAAFNSAKKALGKWFMKHGSKISSPY